MTRTCSVAFAREVFSILGKDSFVQLVMDKERTLYHVARSMLRQEADQKDAVQEAITKAWERRNTLREEKYFTTWLVRILINECKLIGRRQSRFVLTDSFPDQERVDDSSDAVKELTLLVDALPDKQRLPVVLHYIEGFTLQEIASLLHCPLGTIKKRLFAARKQLQREYVLDWEVTLS